MKKGSRQFKIDFDEDGYKYFNKLNYNFLKKERCIADDDGLFYFKMRGEMYALDQKYEKTLYQIKENQITSIKDRSMLKNMNYWNMKIFNN